MRDKTWLRLLLAGLAVLLVFGACSNDPTDDTGSPSATAEDDSSIVTEEEGEIVEVKYNVWDDSKKNPPEDTELVAAGQEPWKPDFGKVGADAEVIADVLVGEDLEFTFYPDGRDGTEILAEIFIDPEQLPRTDEPLDVIIYIEDDQVVIESGFVGYSETFER